MHIIGGKHKKRRLLTPKSSYVRPTTSQLREAVFNICQHHTEGAHFLDLFAGSGAMGLEALSRGAAHTTFVEKGRLSLVSIKRNIAHLGEEQTTTLVKGDAVTLLPLLTGPFDIIYADPPYREKCETSMQVLKMIDNHLQLRADSLLFIEAPSLPDCEFKNLALKYKRSFGRTTLFEFRKVILTGF